MTTKSGIDQKINHLTIGIVFVTLGAVFFVANLFPQMRIGRLWPFFMLIPVIFLAGIWIRKGAKASAASMPITILLFFFAYFLWLNFSGWHHVSTTWPNFLMGPGLGFLAFYFIRRSNALLLPAFLLISLGSIFYLEIVEKTFFIGIILIFSGIPFLLRWASHSRKAGDSSEK